MCVRSLITRGNLMTVFLHVVQQAKSSKISVSAPWSRPDSLPTLLLCRAEVQLCYFSFKFLPDFVKTGSFARLLLPAQFYERIHTVGTVLRGLHAIAFAHFLLHVLERLQHRNNNNQQTYYLHTLRNEMKTTHCLHKTPGNRFCCSNVTYNRGQFLVKMTGFIFVSAS